jgi:alkylation response protein AidB-like acyl-CoA dehydrogenase
VGLCAELSGAAERVVELSVAYAKTREQFGQPIGRFQALQHKCADMLIASEGIRSAAYYAAWALEQDEPHAPTSACLAKAYCSEAWVKIAGEGIQIHGGLAYGSPELQREIAARSLIDSPSASLGTPLPT